MNRDTRSIRKPGTEGSQERLLKKNSSWFFLDSVLSWVP
jgi:hypothetical protein